jgi:predicted ribonuclease YlaK
MKEEAIRLSEELLNSPEAIIRFQASAMIKGLVEELNKTERKYKDMHNLATQAMSQVHQLEKDKRKEWD